MAASSVVACANRKIPAVWSTSVSKVMFSLFLSLRFSVMTHFCLGSVCHLISQQLNGRKLDSVSNLHFLHIGSTSLTTLLSKCIFSLFFPPFKRPSFLFWLLSFAPLSFLCVLTLSGLVSCVTGNVTVSFFFPSWYYCSFISPTFTHCTIVL